MYWLFIFVYNRKGQLRQGKNYLFSILTEKKFSFLEKVYHHNEAQPKRAWREYALSAPEMRCNDRFVFIVKEIWKRGKMGYNRACRLLKRMQKREPVFRQVPFLIMGIPQHFALSQIAIWRNRKHGFPAADES